MSEREELEAVKVLASELFIDQYSAHKDWETATDMAENFDTDAFVERIATALLSSGYTKGNGGLVEALERLLSAYCFVQIKWIGEGLTFPEIEAARAALAKAGGRSLPNDEPNVDVNRLTEAASGGGGWQPIETALTNGELIEVCAMGPAGPEDRAFMRWSPTMRNGMFPGEQGFWVAPGGAFTWRPGEFGPTHWRPAASSESEDTPPKATPSQDDVDALVKAARIAENRLRVLHSQSPHEGATKEEVACAQLTAALTPFQKG